MRVTILGAGEDEQYDSLLTSDPHTLMYASSAYRDVLDHFLVARPRYLIARKGGEMQAALPCFLSAPGTYGAVLNSLPFYGSNGGVVPASAPPEARAALLNAFFELAHEQQCAAATIIVSPFDESVSAYEERIQPDFVDMRIGQLTPLPQNRTDREDLLLRSFHGKTRNLVRKGGKNDFQVRRQATVETFEFLEATHMQSMRALGRQAKPSAFFRAVRKRLTEGKEFGVYTAFHQDEPVAALLLLYFNRTVEYFLPVVKKEFRAAQPLSLLIFRAMVDAAGRGYAWWNWGGTWPNQDSLYHFKNRWGTQDKNYYYYVKLWRPELRTLSKDDLLSMYPYFFTIPFDGLGYREDL